MARSTESGECLTSSLRRETVANSSFTKSLAEADGTVSLCFAEKYRALGVEAEHRHETRRVTIIAVCSAGCERCSAVVGRET